LDILIYYNLVYIIISKHDLNLVYIRCNFKSNCLSCLFNCFSHIYCIYTN